MRRWETAEPEATKVYNTSVQFRVNNYAVGWSPLGFLNVLQCRRERSGQLFFSTQWRAFKYKVCVGICTFRAWLCTGMVLCISTLITSSQKHFLFNCTWRWSSWTLLPSWEKEESRDAGRTREGFFCCTRITQFVDSESGTDSFLFYTQWLN